MDSGLWPPSSTSSPAEAELIPCNWDSVRAAMQRHCWKKRAFLSSHLQSLSISPLPIKTSGFVSLAPDLQTNIKWLDLFQRTQTKMRGLYTLLASALHLEAPRMRHQEPRRRVKSIWATESITNAAEPSPVPSTIGEEQLRRETQDSALTFPEIPWRGLFRFIEMGQRPQPEEICDSGDSDLQELVE